MDKKKSLEIDNYQDINEFKLILNLKNNLKKFIKKILNFKIKIYNLKIYYLRFYCFLIKVFFCFYFDF